MRTTGRLLFGVVTATAAVGMVTFVGAFSYASGMLIGMRIKEDTLEDKPDDQVSSLPQDVTLMREHMNLRRSEDAESSSETDHTS